MRRLASFDERRIVFFIHAGVAMKIRPHHARIHRIHAHTFRRELQGCASRELIDGGFADAICEDTGKSPKPGNAGNVHNVALAIDDGRQGELCELEHRSNVDVHHQVIVRERRILYGSACDDARGIHEDVHSTHILYDVLHESGRFALVQ